VLDRGVNRLTLVIVMAVALVACGGGGTSTAHTRPRTTLYGAQRDPLPQVAAFTLPDASNGNVEFPMRARPGGLLLVYFGYTNCPDVCPGTLAGLKLARHRLPAAEAAKVQVAMVTVDPTRDTGPVLSDYLARFLTDAHALVTDDQNRLSTLAEAFGVQYDVQADAKGGEQVGHSSLSFAVDDRGRIVDSWPYGFEVSKIAADIRLLLRTDANPT
jgi:protein SCO1/2